MGRLILGALGLIAALLAVGYLALHRGDISYEKLDAQYRTPASHMLDMGGGVVAHWRDEGNPAGRPLLLVHGFSSSTQTWDKWIPALQGEYRLISIDLPGHGLTRTPKGYAPSVEGYADFLDAFMQKIGAPHATVIGSSMGGHTAWMFALRHPQRVDALVLVGAAGWRTPNTSKDRPAIFGLLRNPVLGPLMRDLDNTSMVRAGVQAAFVNRSLVDDAMVARYVNFSRAPNHRATLLAITTADNASSAASKEKLAAIHVPTLVMHGARDNLVPVAGASLFGEAIPGAEVIIYDQVGHVPQEEIPERSAADLIAFLHKAFLEAPAGAPLAATLP